MQVTDSKPFPPTLFSFCLCIWFGRRASEVQILSPRPIFSISSSHSGCLRDSVGVDFVTVKASQIHNLWFIKTKRPPSFRCGGSFLGQQRFACRGLRPL